MSCKIKAKASGQRGNRNLQLAIKVHRGVACAGGCNRARRRGAGARVPSMEHGPARQSAEPASKAAVVSRWDGAAVYPGFSRSPRKTSAPISRDCESWTSDSHPGRNFEARRCRKVPVGGELCSG